MLWYISLVCILLIIYSIYYYTKGENKPKYIDLFDYLDSYKHTDNIKYATELCDTTTFLYTKRGTNHSINRVFVYDTERL